MAVANFEALCKGLCELAGVKPPGCVPDANGSIAIEVQLQGVRTILMHEPQNDSEHMLILAVFGPLPAGRELQACRTLLELNCQVHALGYAFGRNPATEDIVLKQRCAFSEVSAVELYRRLVEMVEGIKGWRQHHFLVEIADGEDSIQEARK